MLRTLKYRRLYSTALPVLKHNNTLAAYQACLKSKELSSSNIDEIMPTLKNDELLPKTDKISLYNLILSDLLGKDASLAAQCQRELQKLGGKLEMKSLGEIIKYNSGRNKTSWEVFEEHYDMFDASGGDEVLASVLVKLVRGELIDQGEETEDIYKISDSNLVKSVWLMSQMGKVDLEMKKEVLNECLSRDFLGLVGLIDLKDIDMYEYPFDKFVKLFYFKQEVKFNEFLPKLVLQLSQSSEAKPAEYGVSEINSLNERFGKPKVDTIVVDKEQLFSRLMQELSPSIKFPELFETRLAILKALAMNKQDLGKLLEYYHEFISFDKLNLFEIMEQMVVNFGYLYIYSGNEMYKQLMETMLPEDESKKVLQCLIVCSETDKSLELFNKHLKKSEQFDVGLVHSLILKSLSENDREFAYLIHDGSVQNGIISTDENLKSLKSLFKRYGDILGSDESERAELLKLELLKHLRSL